jgi:2-oxoglutarate ferredoxin oxidoreductase subunit delta
MRRQLFFAIFPKRRPFPVKGYIEINKELCKECHLCLHACKKGLIVTTQEFNLKGYHPVAFAKGEECNGCTLCAIVCPEVAIEVYRE